MLAIKDKSGAYVADVLQFVPFEIATPARRLKFVLNVQKIKEVVEIEQISDLPNLQGKILGIYDLRGTPVPVVNIASAFAEPGSHDIRPTLPSGTRLLICELQGLLIALPVGNTFRMITCSGEDFLPPSIVTHDHDTRLLSGLVRQNDRYLPILDIDSLLFSFGLEPAKEQLNTADTIQYPGKRILVAEDSHVIQRKLEKLFLRLGMRVTLVSNGEEGLRAFKQQEGAFDLIFTDIEMPLLDGVAMARAIKALPQGRAIPIIFNSALSNPALIQDLAEEKLGSYVVKFDEEVILRHLKTLFG